MKAKQRYLLLADSPITQFQPITVSLSMKLKSERKLEFFRESSKNKQIHQKSEKWKLWIFPGKFQK